MSAVTSSSGGARNPQWAPVGAARPRLGRHWLGWSAAFVSVLAGLLFATSAKAARGTDLRPGEHGDLASLVRARQARIEAAEGKVRALRSEIRQARAERASGGPGPVVDASAVSRVEQLAALAGLAPVQGPAVEIVLDDAPLSSRSTAPEDYNPDDFVVHEQDLQGVVNALWAGGAEALQLMDQRVISTSAVRCVGSTVFLQGRIYPPPYRIVAVGPTEEMLRALEESPSVSAYRLYVEEVGLRYDVRTLPSVVVPGYEGALSLNHAAPVRKD